MSPEVGLLAQRSRISSLVRYFLSPFVSPILHKWRLIRNRSDSYPMSFDFNWSTKNYNRIALINLLLGKYLNPSYLEIGCALNSSFDSIPIPDKVGVDPYLGGNVRMTSDEFFNINKRTFDVVFIDGLHTFEQVRRDFLNAMRVTNDGGWILIHDMLPKNWVECQVPRISTGSWTGDVWKLGFELVKLKEINFKIINIDMGVGLFRVPNNEERIETLGSAMRSEKFEYLFTNFKDLPVIEFNEARDWINKRE